MPFRERIKRALTRSSASSTTSNPSSTPTDASRRNSHIYQPGEKMPPPKYRRPVAPEHKEKLESFSWAKAWRRHSGVSQYSPMGSRVPSRKNSTAAPTIQGRRSYQAARASLVGSTLTREMNGVVAIDHANGKNPFHHPSHAYRLLPSATVQCGESSSSHDRHHRITIVCLAC